ncbi:MAG: hypothetical protein PHS38_06905 [Bacteroidales bacterium]|nr:hypothetical protein [Bacteroidales bacterium]
MIEVRYKIHDEYSIEFKQRFLVRQGIKDNRFEVNTWLFIPNSLDITPQTYGQDLFYRDVKSNVRLITPVYTLCDLGRADAAPFRYLKQAFTTLAGNPDKDNTAEFVYQIKMVSVIIKGALRDHASAMIREVDTGRIREAGQEFIACTVKVLEQFRKMKEIINVPAVSEDRKAHFLFGDEAVSQLVIVYALKILSFLRDQGSCPEEEQALRSFVTSEYHYKRKMGYSVLDTYDREKNKELVYRYGLLKKYIESDLFVTLDQKKDGIALEQIYYSIAAGVAMIFATVVAFIFQRRFGMFSIPLFLALVISYMLKDRIKDLMRYYFAYKRKGKYFDHKSTVRFKDKAIGWIKEGMDFISPAKVPAIVMDLRNCSNRMMSEYSLLDEKIILYRKLVHIDSREMEENNLYTVDGINDIFRLHINRLTQKMDNPLVPLMKLDETTGDLLTIEAPKIYNLHIIMQVRSEDHSDFRAFKVVASRDGIKKIEPPDLPGRE